MPDLLAVTAVTLAGAVDDSYGDARRPRNRGLADLDGDHIRLREPGPGNQSLAAAHEMDLRRIWETIPSSRRRYFVSIVVIQLRPISFVARLPSLSHLLSIKLKRVQHSQRLVTGLLYTGAVKGKQMLRISMNHETALATLKVEGRVVGPWAAELGKTWRRLWALSKQSTLQLDLRGVTYVDSNGARILREIVKATGAEVRADSPLTQYFANQAKRDMALEPAEEN
jgi:ABC-type transporter Mla MlaB component